MLIAKHANLLPFTFFKKMSGGTVGPGHFHMINSGPLWKKFGHPCSTLFLLYNIVIRYRSRNNTAVWLLSFLFKVLCEVHWAEGASRRQKIVWMGGLYCAIHRCTLRARACFRLMIWVASEWFWSGVECSHAVVSQKKSENINFIKKKGVSVLCSSFYEEVLSVLIELML